MSLFQRKNVNRVESRYDHTLALLIVLLSLFGLVMIYSTSSYNAARYYSDPTKYLVRQGKFLAAGLAGMFLISQVDYHYYVYKSRKIPIRPIWIYYVFMSLLQMYAVVNGYSAGGSSRWISISGVSNFQPSEFLKIGVLILAAYIVQIAPQRLDSFGGFLGVSLYFAPVIAMVAVLNLSSAVIIAVIYIAVCFCVSRKKWYYWIILILGIAFMAAFIYFVDYRSSRIDNWINPDNMQSGDQILEGLYAIASGGVFGKGLGQSVQKQGYIPEVHTDMIFTIICEELGLFGAGILIVIYLLVLWRIYIIATNAPDMFGGLIASGALAHIAIQMILNIAVVTNLVPATGITLPFVSYGGSSLLVLLCEMGAVLSVSKYTKKE